MDFFQTIHDAVWGSNVGIRIIVAIALLLTAFIISRLFSRAFHRIYHKLSDGDKAGSIFSIIIKAIVYSICISLILDWCFDIEPTLLWGALGVGGVALSLGLQETISNLLGGIFISVNQSLKIGDWITIGSIGGEVKDINWRFTTIVDDLMRTHNVPNSVLNSTSFTRMPEYQRIDIPLTLARDIDIAVERHMVCKAADDSLIAAGMSYPDMPSRLSVSGLTANGLETTLTIFSSWSFATGVVKDAVLSDVTSYLKRNELLPRLMD